ncbi:hypothetical protein [Arenimonas sp.]|uniref:hypothetical protein n=1 Tax=Arenimonas sp. TaxID=1872635 RepID=UPI0035AFFDF2
MLRIVLSLSLLFATAAVQAAEATPAETDPGTCAKSAGAAEKPAEAAAAEPATTPGATSPVRPRSGAASGRPTPRWNSLLPGMIR